MKVDKLEKKFEILKFYEPENENKKLSHAELVREKIAKRACLEFKNGMYVNLGIGIPTLIPNFLPSDVKITLHGENGILGMGRFPMKGEEDVDLINATRVSIEFYDKKKEKELINNNDNQTNHLLWYA